MKIPNWTSERYRDLARACRSKAETSTPGAKSRLLAMADGYEAQAKSRDYKRAEGAASGVSPEPPDPPSNVVRLASRKRRRNRRS